MKPRRQFLQGNEAMLEGALAAGASFFAGYPITPSSEIAEGASRRLPSVGGVYLQMEDELASMAAIIGASLAGRKSFTATSGPGISLMQENLGVAIMAEVPCVIIDVQRSGPSTGLATKPAQADTMQVRWGSHGDHSAVVLAPSTVQDCFDLTVRAFNLAEQLRHPVYVLADEIVGHMREDVLIPDEVEVITRRSPGMDPDSFRIHAHDERGIPVPLPPFGSPFIYHANSSMHDETGYPNADPDNAGRMIRRLHDKVEGAVGDITGYSHYGPGDPRVLIIAYGCSARTALQLVLDQPFGPGGVALLQLKSLWPFPDRLIREFTSGDMPVVVPELNLGQVVREVRRVLGPDYPCHSCTKSDGVPIGTGEMISFIEEEVL
ncbi:MAG: 2-oxoacid:acceptor oxidoreductase subunit alpha [Bacillota bacterium]